MPNVAILASRNVTGEWRAVSELGEKLEALAYYAQAFGYDSISVLLPQDNIVYEVDPPVDYVVNRDRSAVYLRAELWNRLRVIPVPNDYEALWLLRREGPGE